MKFVLASYGTRGDIEPCVAVGRELQRRGHDVRLAVPPNLVGFAESAGLSTVAYGLDTQAWLDAYRNFWTTFFRSFWRVRELIRLWREAWQSVTECWQLVCATLMAEADGADLVLTGPVYPEAVANVTEFYGIPLAALHYYPMRANGQLSRFLPSSLGRWSMTAYEWLIWRTNKKLDDTQRRELGLPKATSPSPQRVARRGSLEIQAYDAVCFPGLPAEWAKWGSRRPFVGALTMELTTGVDDEVASWIAAGTPPICFGFGSIAVESPAETVEMISAACAQLGERALICGGGTDFSDVPHRDHVKVVGAMNYAATFPACRAVVHAGGTGTTAASLRAGVPTLVLWMAPDQTVWAVRVKRLKVGTARSFSATTQESLVSDLRQIMAPEYVSRAREVAAKMSKPAESIAGAADVMENFVRVKCAG